MAAQAQTRSTDGGTGVLQGKTRSIALLLFPLSDRTADTTVEISPRIGAAALLALLFALGPARAVAAPFLPQSDQQVLEKLPARATDPKMRELTALRRQR